MNMFSLGKSLGLLLLGICIFVIYVNIYINNGYVYGEDGTWINNFIDGNISNGLMPRNSFLILGTTIQQLIAHNLADSYQAYAKIKTIFSLISILIISGSFFINGFLKKYCQFVLFCSLALPITLDIGGEVFGHLHNLVWYFPILLYNCGFAIFSLVKDTNLGKATSIKIGIYILLMGVGGTLFPLCAVINILFTISLLCYLNSYGKHLFAKGKALLPSCTLASLALNIIIITNSADRSSSIISEKAKLLSNNTSYLSEYFSRQIMGIFTYLPSYSINSIYQASFKILIVILILSLYFDLIISCCNKLLSKSSMQPKWVDLIPIIYASVVPFSFLAILYFKRFNELSYFLDGFKGDGYPNRYYITSLYLFSTSTFILASSNLSKDTKERALSFLPLIISSFVSKVVLILSLLVIVNQFTLSKNNYFDNPVSFKSLDLRNRITCYDKYLIVDAKPNIFKTIINSKHKWYSDLRDKC